MPHAIVPPSPPLSGGGIRLRPWEIDDAGDIARIAADPEVPRWTYLPEGMTEEHARQWIERGHEAAELGTGLPLAITDGDHRVLGNVGLGSVDLPFATAEVYWWLDVQARGRGSATAAVLLMARWAFDQLGLARLAAHVEPANRRSLALAERVGFHREGVMRAAEPAKDGCGRIDLVLLSLLPDDLAP